MSHGDVLWSHYVILNCSNLMLAPDTNLNSVESNWNSVDSVLMPNKCIIALPKMCTVTFGSKKNALGDVSISSLALYKQKSIARENIVPKFTNWLSWALHTNANVKVLSESNFFIYGQNPRTYIGKYVSEKTCTFAYFTQCYLFHLLAQKRTDYCTRIIDVTVNN